MAKKENTKDRARAFTLLLYPDCPGHVQAMELIEQSFDYACICHNQDVDEDGVIKKEHCHYVVRFTNAKWNSALAKELGIEVNYIQVCRNLDNSLMYLVHFNDTDKAQYNIDEVKGSLKTRLIELLQKNGKGESEKVCDLLDYIDNSIGLISVKEFTRYCAQNGYWAEYRRSASIFMRIIDEHNSRYVGGGQND